MGDALCCQQLSTCAGTGTPFRRIIGFGLYDGLTSGVAECQACGCGYRFDMIDAVGDSDTTADIRIFALAPLPAGSFDLLVEACPKPPSPDWSQSHVWVPRWSFPTKALQVAANAHIEAILAQAAPANLVVAWTPWGGESLVARKLTADDLPDLAVVEWTNDPRRARDWVAFLALSRERQPAQ